MFDVSGDAVTTLHSGTSGNSTVLVDLDGTPGLITTLYGESVAVYELTAPDAPVEVVSQYVDSDSAREVVFDASLERFYTVGRNRVVSLAFDGAGYTTLDAYERRLGTRQYRDVALAGAEDRLLAAWWDDSGGSGVELFAVAEDGALTLLDGREFDDGVRPRRRQGPLERAHREPRPRGGRGVTAAPRPSVALPGPLPRPPGVVTLPARRQPPPPWKRVTPRHTTSRLSPTPVAVLASTVSVAVSPSSVTCVWTVPSPSDSQTM